MSQCNHEEADTCIVKDSLERGDQVHTVDTDVVVVLIGEFYNLQEQNPKVGSSELCSLFSYYAIPAILLFSFIMPL